MKNGLNTWKSTDRIHSVFSTVGDFEISFVVQHNKFGNTVYLRVYFLGLQFTDKFVSNAAEHERKVALVPGFHA